MPPKYKLTYFNFRARAEVARLLFALADVEYEDVRIEREDWPNHKHKYPYGQLPVLEIDDKMYCQSFAIQRHLARKFGLAGKNPLDELRADMIVETCDDMLWPILLFFIEDQDEKAKMRKTFIEEKLPATIHNLERLLIENQGGDGYFVGNELTWADLDFIQMIEWVEHFSSIDWSRYPKLAALRTKVLKVPRIAAWIEKRPTTDF